jgi:hypothetical protein
MTAPHVHVIQASLPSTPPSRSPRLVFFEEGVEGIEERHAAWVEHGSSMTWVAV